MKSIRDIYKIGVGPSSSHTMGPARAAKLFRKENPNADAFKVILYGSLCKTGVGHGTDRVLREMLAPLPTEIIFSKESLPGCHPNTMDFVAYQEGNEIGRCVWNPWAAVISASWAAPMWKVKTFTPSTPLQRSMTSASGATCIASATMWN